MITAFDMSFRTIRRTLSVLAVLMVAACGSPEQRAQSYYERGMKLLSQQDYVKADIEFRNALQLKRDLVGAWRGLAQIEEHNSNWQALVPIRRTIVELDPKDAKSRRQLAAFMMASNVLDDALNMINAALELEPRHSGALAIRAAVLLKLNDTKGAIREAHSALEIDPANSEATAVLAAERLGSGDAESALQILEQAPAADSKIGVQLFKIKILEQLKDLKQVELVLRKLIKIYPKQTGLQNALVKLYIDEKRPDDAERELRAIAAENPTDVNAELNVVRFLQATKGPAAAREELVARTKAGGETFGYQIALAEFDFAQGNITESIQLLQKLATGADSRDHAVAAQAKLAEIHLSNKKLDAAEAIVTEILRKDNRNANGLKLRAAIRLDQGQLEAAIADARQALNDQPRSAELMLLLATAYERSGSIELAEKQLADAARVSEFNPAVSINYVNFLRRRGSIERAEDVLSELVTRAPANIGLLSDLAEIRLSRQNWVGAQEIAERIRAIGSDGDLADRILGVALSGQSKFDESISVLESVFSAAPKNAQPMIALVVTLVRAKELDRATAFLQTVLKENPANAEARVLLGAVEIEKNAPDDALKSFQAAVDQQPKNMIGYRALAEFYIGQKRLPEAEKIVRAALLLEAYVRSGSGSLPNSESFVMHLALARVLELKGSYDDAIAEYESLLKQQSGSLVVINNLASLLADHRTDKTSLDRAYSLAAALRKSQVPAFKDTLGWIYYQRGDYKGAISLLEEAAIELPDRALIRYHLGMGYLAAGQREKAVEQLKKARELGPNDSDLEGKIKAAQEKAAI